jgi:hypothetical protein
MIACSVEKLVIGGFEDCLKELEKWIWFWQKIKMLKVLMS